MTMMAEPRTTDTTLDATERFVARRGFDRRAVEGLGAQSCGDEVYIPMYTGAGAETGVRKRRADGTMFPGGMKALTNAGGTLGLMFNRTLLEREAVAQVLWVEGEGDLCAAGSQPGYDVVGTPGATPGQAVSGYAESLARSLGSPECVLFPHGDPAGQKWTALLAAALRRAGCEVRIVPSVEGQDLDDRLRAVADRKALMAELVDGAEPYKTDAATTATESTGVERHFTETGLADRFEREHKGEFLYNCDSQLWLVYDTRRWAPDRDGAVARAMQATVRALYREAADCLDSGAREDMSHWAQRTESARYQEAALRLAQSRIAFAVTSDQFDRDPYTLNCLNCTFDLKTQIAHPHDSKDLLTKVAGAALDIDAHSELWDSFIGGATGHNADLAQCLAVSAGCSILGDNREEVGFMVVGPEASGKSTMLESIRGALGDYAGVTAWDTFLGRHGGGPRPEIIALRGLRLLIASELESGRKLAASTFKQLTGRDTLSARDLHARPVEFTPVFTPWLSCNEGDLPSMPDDDGALWRRLRIVPFAFTVRPEDRRPELKTALTEDPEQRKAILAWLVRGCHTYLTDGLGDPAAIRDATAAVRERNNPLARFLTEECAFGPTLRVSRADLRTAYEGFCHAAGEKAVGGRVFCDHIRAKGATDARLRIGGKTTRCWTGIGLTDAEAGDGEDTV